MLVYRNRPMCTYTVPTCIYPLRMALAGGQLSCSFSHFRVQTCNIHCLAMYKIWHTSMYAFLKKCYRKADHLPEPFLGGISLYETCMYTLAYSCTLASSKGGTGTVQASMNCIPQGNTLSRESFCMLMVWNRMNQDEPCTDMYIHCTAIVQICIYKLMYLHTC